jgi:hypothetical protein
LREPAETTQRLRRWPEEEHATSQSGEIVEKLAGSNLQAVKEMEDAKKRALPGN